MTYEAIMKDVQDIFREIMENDSIVLTGESNSDQIEEWDSLTHIQLVVEIEKHFKINFTSEEIGSFENVGEMCKGIEKKLNG